jgi:hypothetical protein
MAAESRDPGMQHPPRTEGLQIRDRVRWGPILAGLLTTISVFLILGLLGVAIGLTVFDEGTDAVTVGTGAAIWGILAALIAFVAGGWVSSWAANQSEFSDAILNGAMVGVAAIVALLWLVGTGVGYLFGAVTANIEVIAQIGSDLAVGEIDVATAEAALDDAQAGTWATLIGMVVAIIAAALGGWMGRQPAAEELAAAEERRRAEA